MSTPSSTSSTIHYDPPEVNSGTTTSWIPLTTTWLASSGCASSFYLYPRQGFPVAWDPGYGYWFGGTPRCLPPAATTWWEQNHQGGDGFTSVSIRPIVCPSAFTTAATSVEAGSSTAVLCCPSGYDLLNGEQGQVVGQCYSQITSGQTLQYLASTVVSSGQTVLTKTTTMKSSTSIEAIYMMGWNVATPSPTSSSTMNTSTPAVGNNGSGGLSTGAKAGIGVSAAIGGLGLLAFVGAFFLLRRRPREARYDAVGGNPVPGYAHEGTQIPKVHEVQDVTMHEMAAPNKPYELDQHRSPMETR